MSGEVNLQPFRIPLVDAQGLMTAPWQRYIQQITIRVGGTTGPSIPDVTKQITSAVAGVLNDLGQDPAPIPAEPVSDDLAPAQAAYIAERIDPAPGYEDLRAQLTEALKRIEALESKP